MSVRREREECVRRDTWSFVVSAVHLFNGVQEHRVGAEFDEGVEAVLL
jgi:hypothetical protein